MYHRKSEHPSTVATCINYQTDVCDFDEDRCWWKHGSKVKQKPNLILQSNECQVCGKTFNDKGSFMKHMKNEHVEMVPACRNFANNWCNRNDSSCWFVHTTEVVENMEVEQKSAEKDEKVDDLFFCKAAKKTPQDQIEKLMGLIMKLLQVQNLERKTNISQ